MDSFYLPIPQRTGELDPVNKEIEALSRDEELEKPSRPEFRVFITTNEVGVEKTTSALSLHEKKVNVVHVGFSGLHNFDIMVSRRSAYGLICDISPNNKRFVDYSLEVIKSSENRQVFIEKIAEYVENNKYAFTCIFSKLKELQKEFSREGSWLFSDESFAYIKKLASDGKIVAITEDIRNSETFKKVAEIYKRNQIEIDSLYLSNINWCMGSEEDAISFSETVKALIKEGTLVINCPGTYEHEFGAVTQMLRLGKEFLLPLGGLVLLFRIFEEKKEDNDSTTIRS